MYSYADRMRAVQLYIKLGKRVGLTIRRLGYPTKNLLKQWCREYERDHDLVAGYVRTKPWCSDEQKRISIEHYLSHGRCAAQTRTALGYPCCTPMRAWIHECVPGTRRHIVGNATTTTPRSEQQKQAAVINLCARRGSVREVAEAVGVSRRTLYNWKDQRLGRGAPSSMARHHDLPATASREELQRELEILRRDVQRLQLEHDLLEKANELLKNLWSARFLQDRSVWRKVGLLKSIRSRCGNLCSRSLMRAAPGKPQKALSIDMLFFVSGSLPGR